MAAEYLFRVNPNSSAPGDIADALQRRDHILAVAQEMDYGLTVTDAPKTITIGGFICIEETAQKLIAQFPDVSFTDQSKLTSKPAAPKAPRF